MGNVENPVRRNLLKLAGVSLLRPGVEAVRPIAQLFSPERLSKWNSVIIRPGDTLWSICNFYGISCRQTEVVKLNKITDPDKIYEGQTLWLPVGINYLQTPFSKFFLQGEEPHNYFLFTADHNGFLTYNEKMILYEGIDFPYVLTGHSSPDSSSAEDFPFHTLLRRLLSDRNLELKFWLERSNGNGYVEGVLKGQRVGYSSDYKDKEIKQANSRNLILRTCAVETASGSDVLYCCAPIVNYKSPGPKT